MVLTVFSGCNIIATLSSTHWNVKKKIYTVSSPTAPVIANLLAQVTPGLLLSLHATPISFYTYEQPVWDNALCFSSSFRSASKTLWLLSVIIYWSIMTILFPDFVNFTFLSFFSKNVIIKHCLAPAPFQWGTLTVGMGPQTAPFIVSFPFLSSYFLQP